MFKTSIGVNPDNSAHLQFTSKSPIFFTWNRFPVPCPSSLSSRHFRTWKRPWQQRRWRVSPTLWCLPTCETASPCSSSQRDWEEWNTTPSWWPGPRVGLRPGTPPRGGTSLVKCMKCAAKLKNNRGKSWGENTDPWPLSLSLSLFLQKRWERRRRPNRLCWLPRTSTISLATKIVWRREPSMCGGSYTMVDCSCCSHFYWVNTRCVCVLSKLSFPF